MKAHHWGERAVTALVVAISVAAGAGLSAYHATAQTVGPQPGQAPAPGKSPKAGKGQAHAAGAAGPIDPAASARQLEAGIRTYQAGKFEPAVKALSEALQGGGLREPDVGRALYYRGSAYRKLGQPAQAISDLTSALWLKNGLVEAQRTDALTQRSEAYREAGLGEAPPPDIGAKVAAGSGQGAAKTASNVAPPAAAPANGGFGLGGVFGGLFGSSPTKAPESPAPPPPATVAAAPPPAPPSPAAAPATSIAAAVERSPVVAAPAAAPQTTGSIGSAVSSWTQATEVQNAPRPAKIAEPKTPGPKTADAKAADAKAAARAPAGPKVMAALSPGASAAPPAVAAPIAPNGRFRLQVAAVRSREEADAVVSKLRSSNAAGAEPTIDQAVFGNMGTFYRVRLGPYANARTAGEACAGLKASGFDCLVGQN